MTYMEKAYNRKSQFIGLAIIICWAVFVIATFLKLDVIYNFMSPVITFLCVFLLRRSRENMGKYWIIARWFAIGIFIWFISDLFWILNTYITNGSEAIEMVTDNLYLFPDYFYVAGLIQYVRIRVKRNDFQLVMVDSFVLSIAVFVVAQKWLASRNPDYRINMEIMNSILYFFSTMFMLIMIVIILVKTGIKSHPVSFHVLVGTLFLNSLLEMRYTIYLFLGKESESSYLDILYILFMVVYALAFSFGKLGELNIEMESQVDNPDSYIHQHFTRIYWMNAGVVMAVGAVLYFTGFLDDRDIFLFFAICMAYVIMCKTVQANILSEELIQRQKDENARLEQMVEEKTKELRRMNAYLAKISNTDALTGLYNRRFGMDYFTELIRDPENYPIALYSLDLNYFKPINDNYGHDMGDVVLKEVGHRLASLEEKRCTAIRIGGDEFLVIFRNASNMQAIENVGKILCREMDRPIDARVVSEEKGEMEHTFTISASIGVARYPADTTDIDTLFKMADQALYKIKHTHEKSAVLLYSAIQEKDGTT